MRILYDGLIYATQAAGGINRYFANLIERLPSTDSAVLTTPRVAAVNFPRHPQLDVHVPRALGPGPVAVAALPVQLRMAERGFGHDLLHPTFYLLQTLRSFRRVRVPVVVTVWDMTHEIFPEEQGRRGLHGRIMRHAVRHADAVLCISENTRRDLLDRYDVVEDRVRVIPLATDMSAAMVSSSERIPERPYFLYVGSRASYKNFGLLIRAMAALVPTHPDIQLCVVGATLSPDERRLIAGAGLTDRIVSAGIADDARLAALYAGSRALVYPSRYEGFGIPPLEAMACGTVAITSNTSSIPEVVGDAAFTFDPDSLEQLVDHMRTVIDDDGARGRMIMRGRERVARFSWDRTARETVAVYRELV